MIRYESQSNQNLLNLDVHVPATNIISLNNSLNDNLQKPLLSKEDILIEELKKIGILNGQGSLAYHVLKKTFYWIGSHDNEFSPFFSELSHDVNQSLTIDGLNTSIKFSILELLSFMMRNRSCSLIQDLYFLGDNRLELLIPILQKIFPTLFSYGESDQKVLDTQFFFNSAKPKESKSLTFFIKYENGDTQTIKQLIGQFLDTNEPIGQLNKKATFLIIKCHTDQGAPIQLIFHSADQCMLPDKDTWTISMKHFLTISSTAEEISLMVCCGEKLPFDQATIQLLTKTWEPSSFQSDADNWLSFLLAGKRGARILSEEIEKKIVQSFDKNVEFVYELIHKKCSSIYLEADDQFFFILRACLSLSQFSNLTDRQITILWEQLTDHPNNDLCPNHLSFLLNKGLIDQRIPFSVVTGWITTIAWLYYCDRLTFHENRFVFGISNPFFCLLPIDPITAINNVVSKIKPDHIPFLRALSNKLIPQDETLPNSFFLAPYLNQFNINTVQLEHALLKTLEHPCHYLGFIFSQLGLSLIPPSGLIDPLLRCLPQLLNEAPSKKEAKNYLNVLKEACKNCNKSIYLTVIEQISLPLSSAYWIYLLIGTFEKNLVHFAMDLWRKDKAILWSAVPENDLFQVDSYKHLIAQIHEHSHFNPIGDELLFLFCQNKVLFNCSSLWMNRLEKLLNIYGKNRAEQVYLFYIKLNTEESDPSDRYLDPEELDGERWEHFLVLLAKNLFKEGLKTEARTIVEKLLVNPEHPKKIEKDFVELLSILLKDESSKPSKQWSINWIEKLFKNIPKEQFADGQQSLTQFFNQLENESIQDSESTPLLFFKFFLQNESTFKYFKKNKGCSLSLLQFLHTTIPLLNFNEALDAWFLFESLLRSGSMDKNKSILLYIPLTALIRQQSPPDIIKKWIVEKINTIFYTLEKENKWENYSFLLSAIPHFADQHTSLTPYIWTFCKYLLQLNPPQTDAAINLLKNIRLESIKKEIKCEDTNQISLVAASLLPLFSSSETNQIGEWISFLLEYLIDHPSFEKHITFSYALANKFMESKEYNLACSLLKLLPLPPQIVQEEGKKIIIALLSIPTNILSPENKTFIFFGPLSNSFFSDENSKLHLKAKDEIKSILAQPDFSEEMDFLCLLISKYGLPDSTLWLTLWTTLNVSQNEKLIQSLFELFYKDMELSLNHQDNALCWCEALSCLEKIHHECFKNASLESTRFFFLFRETPHFHLKLKACGALFKGIIYHNHDIKELDQFALRINVFFNEELLKLENSQLTLVEDTLDVMKNILEVDFVLIKKFKELCSPSEFLTNYYWIVNYQMSMDRKKDPLLDTILLDIISLYFESYQKTSIPKEFDDKIISNFIHFGMKHKYDPSLILQTFPNLLKNVNFKNVETCLLMIGNAIELSKENEKPDINLATYKKDYIQLISNILNHPEWMEKKIIPQVTYCLNCGFHLFNLSKNEFFNIYEKLMLLIFKIYHKEQLKISEDPSFLHMVSLEILMFLTEHPKFLIKLLKLLARERKKSEGEWIFNLNIQKLCTSLLFQFFDKLKNQTNPFLELKNEEMQDLLESSIYFFNHNINFQVPITPLSPLNRINHFLHIFLVESEKKGYFRNSSEKLFELCAYRGDFKTFQIDFDKTLSNECKMQGIQKIMNTLMIYPSDSKSPVVNEVYFDQLYISIINLEKAQQLHKNFTSIIPFYKKIIKSCIVHEIENTKYDFLIKILFDNLNKIPIPSKNKSRKLFFKEELLIYTYFLKENKKIIDDLIKEKENCPDNYIGIEKHLRLRVNVLTSGISLWVEKYANYEIYYNECKELIPLFKHIHKLDPSYSFNPIEQNSYSPPLNLVRLIQTLLYSIFTEPNSPFSQSKEICSRQKDLFVYLLNTLLEIDHPSTLKSMGECFIFCILYDLESHYPLINSQDDRIKFIVEKATKIFSSLEPHYLIYIEMTCSHFYLETSIEDYLSRFKKINSMIPTVSYTQFSINNWFIVFFPLVNHYMNYFEKRPLEDQSIARLFLLKELKMLMDQKRKWKSPFAIKELNRVWDWLKKEKHFDIPLALLKIIELSKIENLNYNILHDQIEKIIPSLSEWIRISRDSSCTEWLGDLILKLPDSPRQTELFNLLKNELKSISTYFKKSLKELEKTSP